MHVIKVLDKDRIFIGGANGYLFLGNARTGFTNLSSVDDNFTTTGLELFDNQLFIATDAGLFTLSDSGANRQIIPFKTKLRPELQDAHILEAKDGVLWSFGYKDLAYLDTNRQPAQWVRVHHPDNPRIGETQVRQATSTVALAGAEDAAADSEALAPDAQASGPARHWRLVGARRPQRHRRLRSSAAGPARPQSR